MEWNMIQYRHPEGNTFYRQFGFDPIPAWAVDISYQEAVGVETYYCS
jgi:hypothetical protein